MKKIIVLVAAAMISTATWAQNLIFVDNEGNEIKSGSVLNMNTVKDDGWGSYQISLSGLNIKNTGSSTQTFNMSVNVTALPTGTSFMCCYPMNCQSWTSIGVKSLGNSSIGAGETSTIANTEWVMGEAVNEGACIVEFTIPGGPSITVNFDKNATGIKAVSGSSNCLNSLNGSMFNLNGQKVGKDYKGVKVQNGKKVM